jgi:hypothetical protein
MSVSDDARIAIQEQTHLAIRADLPATHLEYCQAVWQAFSYGQRWERGRQMPEEPVRCLEYCRQASLDRGAH